MSLRSLACAALAWALVGCSADLATTASSPLPDNRRSGYDDMSPQTRAMQRDDAQNPGLLWVQGGEALWNSAPAATAKSCAGCHGDATQTLRGVSARYPAFDDTLKQPLNLAGRINQCRQRHQGVASLPAESDDLLSLESYVARQSRGMPVSPPDDPRLRPAREQGAALFAQRIGQLDLSCAQCHDERAGSRLAGNLIPQGHANGYPLYRLEWQGLGTLQRRLRNCMTGVRAEAPAYGAPELVALELYLAWRDRGMAVEAPAVRP